MNTPLFYAGAGPQAKGATIYTGQSYTDGSRHHAAANKEYFTGADSAQWQCGAGNFEIGRWVYLDSVSSQDLINKGAEYSLEVLTNKFRFGVYAGSAWTYVTANTFGALSANTWYFVRAWRNNATTYGSNVLLNSDFEAGALTSWTLTSSSGGVAPVADNTIFHTGSYSAKLSNYYPSITQQHVVTPGQQYTLEFWCRGDGTHQGQYWVQDATHDTPIVAYPTQTGNITTTWTKVTQTYTVPAACTLVTIGFMNYNGATQNTWIDDVTVKLVSAGTINISVNNGTADSVSASAPTAGSGGVVVGKGTAGYFNGRWDSQYVTHRLSTAAEATITYNGGNGQTGLLMSTANPTRFVDIDIWHDGNEAEGTAYDIIGTNHLTAAADPIIAPPVYGSELIVNGGFETAGLGGADVFGTWIETAGDGAISDETTLFHGGAHAAKLTSGATPIASPQLMGTIAVTPNGSYYFSFWTRGDGTNSGRYSVRDATNDVSIVASSQTNNITTTYQLVTLQFTAPATCSSVWIFLKAPNVTGGIVYFDDVSVKQIITPSANNGGFDLRPATGGEKFNVSTVSRSRTSNVATMVATSHGLKNNDVVTITGMTDTSFNGANKVVTVVDLNTITYPSTGSDVVSGADTGGRIATDVFSSWNKTTGGTSMVVAGTSEPYDGIYSLRMNIDASNSQIRMSQQPMIIGKTYEFSYYAKSSSGTPSLTIYCGSGASKTQGITTTYTKYTYSLLCSGSTLFGIYSGASCNSLTIDIDQVTLTSLGPTSEAGIASGLALNTNGVSKLMNDGSAGGQFAQITLAKRPLYSTAYLGGCVLFDGVDDGLVMSDDKIGTGDVTVCAVIRPTGWGGGGYGQIINNSKFYVLATSGQLLASSDTIAYGASAAASLALNTSYVVVITRASAGVVNIYINGVLNGSANQASGTPTPGSNTVLGNRAAYDRAFAGYIGMIGVIGRCLDVGSIQRLSRWLSVQSGGIY